jgi:hypothetical protein
MSVPTSERVNVQPQLNTLANTDSTRLEHPPVYQPSTVPFPKPNASTALHQPCQPSYPTDLVQERRRPERPLSPCELQNSQTCCGFVRYSFAYIVLNGRDEAGELVWVGEDDFGAGVAIGLTIVWYIISINVSRVDCCRFSRADNDYETKCEIPTGNNP